MHCGFITRIQHPLYEQCVVLELLFDATECL